MNECAADLGLKMCNREREELLVASLPFSDDFLEEKFNEGETWLVGVNFLQT